MINEKKMPAHGGNRERAAESAALMGSAFSCGNSITIRGDIATILSVGRKNAITAAELCRLLGMRDTRQVSKQIERERQAGSPILASTDAQCPGYYLPSTLEEYAAYNRSLRHRIRCVCATADALERTFDRLTGQQRIDWEASE